MSDNPSPEHSPLAGPACQACRPTRRGLFRTVSGSVLALGTLALSAAGGLWAAACGRFMWPNVVTEPPTRFRVGFPGDYPADHVETRFKEKHGVWVINGQYQGKRQIFALNTICTHLGCIVLWQESERKFKCPCHGSGFYPNGINYEGPAPRPLERYAIHVADDGQLEVDKSKIFQEELGQWHDGACFVEC